MDDIGERTYSRSAEKVDRRHFKLLSSLPYQRSNRHSTSPRFRRVTSVALRLTTSYSAAAMLLNTATCTRKKLVSHLIVYNLNIHNWRTSTRSSLRSFSGRWQRQKSFSNLIAHENRVWRSRFSSNTQCSINHIVCCSGHAASDSHQRARSEISSSRSWHCDGHLSGLHIQVRTGRLAEK